MSTKEWAADQIVKIKVDDLIPYDRNPKVHPDSQIEQLANSIREWGWTQPILIDEADVVIAGHGRLYAAQKVGLKEVPCVRAIGWSEAKKKAYVIADNKLAEKGTWDNGLLYAELKSINDEDFDLASFGLDEFFENMDFAPNLEPTYSHRAVDDEAVGKAGDNMINAIEAIQSDKSSVGTEVMCPYCAETFKFTGV